MYMIVFTTGCCEKRLMKFKLTARSEFSTDTPYIHKDTKKSAQNMYSVVPSPRISFPVSEVRIDEGFDDGYLTLCEVKVFGGKKTKKKKNKP